ncbi:hypothetical protein Pse7367_1896 [Thalassoporum mexicanum PCC 7367]|nr:hypothetical protein Pse7367_1896 [Pseudanabaena sp. PCC 7367]
MGHCTQVENATIMSEMQIAKGLLSNKQGDGANAEDRNDQQPSQLRYSDGKP